MPKAHSKPSAAGHLTRREALGGPSAQRALNLPPAIPGRQWGRPPTCCAYCSLLRARGSAQKHRENRYKSTTPPSLSTYCAHPPARPSTLGGRATGWRNGSAACRPQAIDAPVRTRGICARPRLPHALQHSPAAHCRGLSRQLTLRRESFRVRARPGAPACIGNNWNCRVSARQCAPVIPGPGLPPVGHDVGAGGVRRGTPGRAAPSARANPAAATTPMQVACQAAPTANLTAGVRTAEGRGGNRYFPAMRANRRPREQPRLETEFVCASESRRSRGGDWYAPP